MLYFLVDKVQDVFKSDATIFTTIGDLFILLKDGDEGAGNNESYLSEECIIHLLSYSLNPGSPSVRSRRSFQDISSHKSVGELSV